MSKLCERTACRVSGPATTGIPAVVAGVKFTRFAREYVPVYTMKTPFGGRKLIGRHFLCRILDAKIKKSGAVFVLPNDRALSVDCSQNGVHAAVSALNKFGQERAKGCQVYLSRRPCSFCAKLLVQCEVSKVYYLPIEPEVDDKEDVLRVDTMFRVWLTYFFTCIFAQLISNLGAVDAFGIEHYPA